MMKQKKTFWQSPLLAITLATTLLLTSCGKTPADEEHTPPTETETESSFSEPSFTEEEEERPALTTSTDLKVASAWAEGGRGYLDAQGQWVIPPSFERATNFSDGFAFVEQGGETFCIDITGEKQNFPDLPQNFQPTSLFSEGYLAVLEKNGYLNTKGELELEIPTGTAQYLGPFSEGYAAVLLQDGTGGYINTAGQWEFSLAPADGYQPSHLGDFKNGNAAVIFTHPETEESLASILDTSGTSLTASYPTIPAFTKFEDGMLQTMVENTDGTRVAQYVDNNDQIFQPTEAAKDLFDVFSDGYLLAEGENDLRGYLGKDGRWAIPPLYQTASTFSEGLAYVWNPTETTYQYIDTQGNIKLDDSFHAASDFFNGVAVVGTLDDGGKMLFRLIDTEGTVLIPNLEPDQINFFCSPEKTNPYVSALQGNGMDLAPSRIPIS